LLIDPATLARFWSWSPAQSDFVAEVIRAATAGRENVALAAPGGYMARKSA